MNRNSRKLQHARGHRQAMIPIRIENGALAGLLQDSSDAKPVFKRCQRAAGHVQQFRRSCDPVGFLMNQLGRAVEFAVALGQRAKRRKHRKQIRRVGQSDGDPAQELRPLHFQLPQSNWIGTPIFWRMLGKIESGCKLSTGKSRRVVDPPTAAAAASANAELMSGSTVSDVAEIVWRAGIRKSWSQRSSFIPASVTNFWVIRQ